MVLEDRVVLVTGASTGIGKATAIELARNGARVIVGYFSSTRGAKATEKECRTFVDADSTRLDVRSESSIRNAVRFVKKRFGRLDALVNNAGIGYFDPFVKLQLKQIQEMLDVNILGVMLTTKHFLPVLAKQKEAVIVNIASMAGYHVWADGTVYCPTKWAVRGFTKALATELPRRVRVYSVNPDRTATSMGNWEGDDPRDVAKIIVKTIKGSYNKKSGADIDVPDFL